MSAVAPRPHVDGTRALIDEARWRYDVGPFREAFLASGMDPEELDRECGWSSGYHRRVLGLRPDVTSRRRPDGTIAHYRSTRTTLSYEHAVALCRALDLDFVEWGV